jgi:hypothetical protein
MTEPAGLTVLVPTRSRPEAVAPLAQAFADTCREPSTTLVFIVDACPRASEYTTACLAARHRYPNTYLHIETARRRLVGQLNHHATRLAGQPPGPPAIGYLGDDHRPRTTGWDTALLTAIADSGGTAIAYGDDMFQGKSLPTAVVISSDIILALGFMAPPSLVHMYCDNFWRDLGQAAGCLSYLPDVAIEHLHPDAGKADWDASYRDSNAASRYAADKAAYDAYRRDRFDADTETIRRLRSTT